LKKKLNLYDVDKFLKIIEKMKKMIFDILYLIIVNDNNQDHSYSSGKKKLDRCHKVIKIR
jgi:hypothetical protein